MIENNEIAKALGQVPELVARTDTLIEDNARKDEIIGKLLQNRMKAEIPASEVEKVVHAATTAVARTRCATPDISGVSAQVADGVMGIIKANIREEVSEAIRNTAEDIPVNVVHTHTTLREMASMAEEKLRIACRIVQVINIILLVIVGILTICHYTSEEYNGQRYAEIAASKYTTKEERTEMMDAAYSISFLPKEYLKSPSTIRKRIRSNEQIIRQRKKEARANKGKFSTKIPLEP
jgi:hypothetical protein